jgi:hypothetical protein
MPDFFRRLCLLLRDLLRDPYRSYSKERAIERLLL